MDDQRCGTDEETLMADAETLVEDPAAHATIREHWTGSLRLWWAVQAAAHSLVEYGKVGDSTATACSLYR